MGVMPSVKNLTGTQFYQVHKPRPHTVRVWSIQPAYVWHELQQCGVLLVNPQHPAFAPNTFPDWQAAYDWLRLQMAQRLPDYEGHYPWWAYDYKLDLRVQRYALGCYGERLVRLELAIAPERLLFSAYGAWHMVLGNDYLPHSTPDDEFQREADAWDAELIAHGLDPYRGDLLSEPWRSRMLASWQRIFEVEDFRDGDVIQATFERLELADVVVVTEFTSLCKHS